MLRSCGLALVFVLASTQGFDACAEDEGELPIHVARDPVAAEVTAGNLLANERFWPYQVALVRGWKPTDASNELVSGTSGVLVRVEEGGFARIDFGRDGLFDVPVVATDLLVRANDVRLGKLDKMAPNFVFAIGPRLLDSAAEKLRPVTAEEFSEPDSFLCVFADPSADGFEAIAKALAPLRERAGLMTVLFPQGAHPDPTMREKLRGLAWPVPFVHDHLSEAYTPSLLAGTSAPALLLVTNEGRALLRASWKPALVAEIAPLLDARR
jgi:hypothetical protein